MALATSPSSSALEPLCAILPQHLGQFRIAQCFTYRARTAVGPVEIGRGHWVVVQVFLAGKQTVEAGADLEAAFGQRDGRLEQGGPWQLAMLAMRHLQHAHRARHADRATADNSCHEWHGLAVGADEEFFVCRRRRGLTPVECLDILAVEMHQEGAATDATGLGFDQCQHHLHGNGCVDRAAAGLEHLVAGIRGQWVGRGNGKLLGRPARLFGVTRCAFGLVRHGVGETARAAGATEQQGGQRDGAELQGLLFVHVVSVKTGPITHLRERPLGFIVRIDQPRMVWPSPGPIAVDRL